MSREEFFITLALFLATPSSARAQVQLQAAGSSYNVPVRTWRDIPFRTVVRQQYDYSCGSAALATLLRYHYGHPIGEAEVFQAMYKAGDQPAIRKVGFSLLDMKKYLASIGMQSDGYRTTLDGVARAGLPVLTVVTIGQYRHFVILKGVGDGQVLIGDPASGMHKMQIEAFQKIWNGIVFAVHDRNTKPVFNDRREWSPYAPGPLGQELDRTTLMGVGTGLPVIYQVLQSTSLLRPTP